MIRRTLLAIRGRVTDGLLAELADLAAAALDWTDTRRRDEWLACAAILRDRHFVDIDSTSSLITT
ncbi:hypothetical protein D3C77_797080 [compost metagenome]